MHALLLPLASLLLPALPPEAGDATWRTEIAFETSDKLGGCAIGDLDPTRAGNEVAIVSGRSICADCSMTSS